MPRRVGAYAKLLANYASDDAIIAAGEAAELLFVRGLAFCATSDSDGYITEGQLLRIVGAGMRDAPRRAARLVVEGLWEKLDGGYLVRSWVKIHETAEEKGRTRRKDRERKHHPIPDGIQMEHAPESTPTLNGAPTDSLSLIHDRYTTGQNSAGNPPAIPETTAQTIIAEWIDHTPKRPPNQVIGQASKTITAMLTEGIDPDDIRRGLAAWMTKGLHPSTIPSVVNEVMNATPTKSRSQQETDDLFDRAARRMGVTR